MSRTSTHQVLASQLHGCMHGCTRNPTCSRAQCGPPAHQQPPSRTRLSRMPGSLPRHAPTRACARGSGSTPAEAGWLLTPLLPLSSCTAHSARTMSSRASDQEVKIATCLHKLGVGARRKGGVHHEGRPNVRQVQRVHLQSSGWLGTAPYRTGNNRACTWTHLSTWLHD